MKSSNWSRRDLEQAGLFDYLRAGVFLCGGCARVPQIAALAEQVMQMPVSLGQTNSISGLKSALDQPEFVSAIGLVKFGSFKTANAKADRPWRRESRAPSQSFAPFINKMLNF